MLLHTFCPAADAPNLHQIDNYISEGGVAVDEKDLPAAQCKVGAPADEIVCDYQVKTHNSSLHAYMHHFVITQDRYQYHSVDDSQRSMRSTSQHAIHI